MARKTRRRIALSALLIALAIGGWLLFRGPHRHPVDETEIFQGVRYGCRTLDRPGTRGLMHWAKVDLSAPGIELYVTPLDAEAVGQGYQYRLRFPETIVRQEGLAVAINGSMFDRSIKLGYWPGDLARGVETVVADGVASHVWEHTYLLWFDAGLVPHVERQKPPPAKALQHAKWGMGGQAVWLTDGRVRDIAPGEVTALTGIGVDSSQHLLILACFESADARTALEELRDLGARDGILVDGGGSTAMVLGAGATAVDPGAVIGGWRPVATHFGVRARPIGR